MLAIFRWWGVGVFAGLVVLLAGGWWLFADLWLERAVESTGSRLVGAKVELRDARLDLFPIRVELNGLQVTNPRSPMRNAVAAERIAFGMDTAALVFGRTRIEEIAVEGAALGTPRSSSGALPKRKRKEAPGAFGGLAAKLALPGLKVPDVGEVLAKGEVRSVAEAQALGEDAGAARERLSGKAEDLPGEAQLTAYRKRIDKLKGQSTGTLGSVLKGGQEAVALKRDIDKDIGRIRDLQKDLEGTRATLKKRLAGLRRMPAEDAARLAKAYGPSAEGLANVAEAFLGPKVAGWMRRGWYWYGVAQPYLAPARDRLGARRDVSASKPLRGEGLDIHFPSGPAEPRTVVREVVFSRQSQAETGLGLVGRVTDITTQPALWPKPLTAALESPGGSPGFAFQARLDHRDPEQGSDRVDLAIHRAPVAGWTLGQGGPLPVEVARGRADMAVKGQLENGRMDLRIRATVEEAVLEVTAEQAQGGELARAAAETLAGVSRFTLAGRVRGTLQEPELTLESSLEEPLRQAVVRVARKRVEALEAGLREKIGARIEPLVAKAEGRLEAIAALDRRLEERLAAFRDLRGRL